MRWHIIKMDGMDGVGLGLKGHLQMGNQGEFSSQHWGFDSLKKGLTGLDRELLGISWSITSETRLDHQTCGFKMI